MSGGRRGGPERERSGGESPLREGSTAPGTAPPPACLPPSMPRIPSSPQLQDREEEEEE